MYCKLFENVFPSYIQCIYVYVYKEVLLKYNITIEGTATCFD